MSTTRLSKVSIDALVHQLNVAFKVRGTPIYLGVTYCKSLGYSLFRATGTGGWSPYWPSYRQTGVPVKEMWAFLTGQIELLKLLEQKERSD